MRLRLEHPGFRTCEDCQKWMYDPDTGEKKYWPPGSTQPMIRPENSATPCGTCPKCAGCETKSPEQGRSAELSQKNLTTWKLYRIVHGARLDASGLDAVAAKNLALIHTLVMSYQQTRRDPRQ